MCSCSVNVASTCSQSSERKRCSVNLTCMQPSTESLHNSLASSSPATSSYSSTTGLNVLTARLNHNQTHQWNHVHIKTNDMTGSSSSCWPPCRTRAGTLYQPDPSVQCQLRLSDPEQYAFSPSGSLIKHQTLSLALTLALIVSASRSAQIAALGPNAEVKLISMNLIIFG